MAVAHDGVRNRSSKGGGASNFHLRELLDLGDLSLASLKTGIRKNVFEICTFARTAPFFRVNLDI